MSRFLIISVGSLILGIFGLLGDIVCPSSYRGMSLMLTVVLGVPDCHTHLKKERNGKDEGLRSLKCSHTFFFYLYSAWVSLISFRI